MKKKDFSDKEPMFKAKDGSYHFDMEGVKVANEFYWDSIANLKINPYLDLPLTDAQLAQIINNPSYSSLINVLEEGLDQQLGEDKSKRR